MTVRTAVPAMRGAGLFRRLAALVYDSFLLTAMLFVATAVVVAFHKGEALPPGQRLYSAYLLVITFVFFGWFWTHGGQTLGMKAWGLRVFTRDGGELGWRHAARRWLAACLSVGSLGLGYLWILIDPEALAWHDRLSGTRVVWIARPNRPLERETEASGAPEEPEQRQHQRE